MGILAKGASSPVAHSLEELLRGATNSEPLGGSDGKSGARLERVVIEGESYVVKHISAREDWTMRVTGDFAGRPLLVWESGLLGALPPSIDHATVAVARWPGGGAILMRDVGPYLVPEGDAPLPMEQHLRFLDHMAQLHARFWGWADRIGLMPLTHRYSLFHPAVMECEIRTGAGVPVPPLVLEGWRLLGERSPEMARVLFPLLDAPERLLAALARTPLTFVHGDWKAGNLGSLPDGRTVLLDWAVPGEGLPCGELGWYLALNAARLPHSKEEAIAVYRAALEQQHIDTRPWWETQLALSLLGTMLQFGWEKALGGDDELRWWEERVAQGARYLEEL